MGPSYLKIKLPLLLSTLKKIWDILVFQTKQTNNINLIGWGLRASDAGHWVLAVRVWFGWDSPPLPRPALDWNERCFYMEIEAVSKSPMLRGLEGGSLA